MEINEALNDVLNDLIMANNDRIAGYEKAIEDAKDVDIDMKATFKSMIDQSMLYKQELREIIEQNNGVVEDDTSPSGKIYRAWIDIKSALPDSDHYIILESCEFVEDTTQRAYDVALTSGKILDESVQRLLGEQQASLKKSHDLINTQKDAYEQLTSHNN